MNASRQSNQIDVKDKGGARTLTATPGTSVVFQVNGGQQSRIGGDKGGPGLYNCIRAKILQVKATIVRASGSSADGPIFADQFPRCISGIGVTTNMFGTEVDATYITGMVAKEISEFFGRGYLNDGINRQPIPAADGTYVRYFELCLPYSQDNNEFPDDFAEWLGWHDEDQIEIFCNNADAPFGIAGVSVTSIEVSCTLEMVPMKNLTIPVKTIVRRYQQAASAASDGPVLVNVGSAGGLDGYDDGCRLESVLFAHQVGGFVGSGTADEINQISMPWRGQALTQNVGMFFDRFLHATGKPTRLGFDPTVSGVWDNSQPYAMSDNPSPTLPLNDSSARYTPLVFPTRGYLLSQVQKWKGNLPLDGMKFGSDQTNQFVVYTREIKQPSLRKCSEMLAAAGIDPNAVDLIPKLGRKNWKRVDASKIYVLPRSIVTKPRKVK